MTSEKSTLDDAKNMGDKASKSVDGQEPDWANGLRQLYDSVVDEPLPDSFKDLLSQLDEKDG
jgi:hypothetical protein